jgi:predicted GNAT superfamily acetyltransferase
MTALPDIRIIQATPADYPEILELNDEAVPAVNSIPETKLAHLHRQSAYLGVARIDDEIAGFLLALSETADYDSINFGYFRRHYPRFTYIDRIVIGARHRGTGLGGRLYEDLQRHVGADCAMLACEVNLRPPNPHSLAFHQRLGFEAVGEQDTEGGSKRVCLMAKRF